MEYSCHDSWSEDSGSGGGLVLSRKAFSIVSYTSESSSAKHCFIKTFNEKLDELSLTLKKGCHDEDEEDSWSFSALNLGDCAPTALAASNSALPRSSTDILVLLIGLLI